MKNDYKVTKYAFSKSITAFCPLGKKGYLAKIEAEVYPKDEIEDFIVIDKAISALEGQSLTGEAMADAVFQILKNAYKTNNIKVAVDGVTNAHLPVVIYKEGSDEED